MKYLMTQFLFEAFNFDALVILIEIVINASKISKFSISVDRLFMFKKSLRMI